MLKNDETPEPAKCVAMTPRVTEGRGREGAEGHSTGLHPAWRQARPSSRPTSPTGNLFRAPQYLRCGMGCPLTVLPKPLSSLPRPGSLLPAPPPHPVQIPPRLPYFSLCYAVTWGERGRQALGFPLQRMFRILGGREDVFDLTVMFILPLLGGTGGFRARSAIWGYPCLRHSWFYK